MIKLIWKEKWKNIIINGISTMYSVSNLGNVRNDRTGKFLSFSIHKKGYYQLSLTMPNGERITRKIHRLVAEAFIPNPENLDTVNHRNYNKKDNRFFNLQWMSNVSNIKDSYINGNRDFGKLTGSKNGNSKYPDEAIHDLCRMLSTGVRICDASRLTNIEKSTIDKILSGKLRRPIAKLYDLI